MTRHDDRYHLEGIKEHILAITQYLPASKEEFLLDTRTQDAVLMRLLAIGEEISHLSKLFIEEHPDLHWFKIVGLRNRIAHGYFEVDQEVIWETLRGRSLHELDKLVQDL